MDASQFKSSQPVKFCPGCGDHAICLALQKAMAQVGIPTHQTVVISGIGCSSRMPHYLNTYGFNTIHGRGGAIATGVKTSHPELNVWQMTGDGDCLAIGGNHFIHELRRNVDLNICLFNNRIYGLTKGQYSPTSKLGKVTKTSPFGTIEEPFSPAVLAIGAKASFVARTIDMELDLTKDLLVEGACQKGMSVVETLVNCVIFNHKTHADYADTKAIREERTIRLVHGEKMLFGKDNQKGLVFENMRLKVVTIGEDGYTEDDVLTHDAHCQDTTLHSMLAAMKWPEYPVAVGIIREVEDENVYDQKVQEQVEAVKASSKITCMDDLLRSGETWEI